MQEKSKSGLLPAPPGGARPHAGRKGSAPGAERPEPRSLTSDLGDPYVLFPLTGPQRTVSGMDTGGSLYLFL